MTGVVSYDVATSPADWPTLRALDPAVAQRIFRACLTAFSRPGTVVRIPRAGLPDPVPAAVAPLLALTDLMTPVAGVDVPGSSAATDAVARVARLTGAPTTTPDVARFALALGEAERMADLSAGSHWSPEAGALLCQRVTGVGGGDAGTWRLRGPGVRDHADVTVAGLTTRFLELRAALTSDFPAGVDILLVDDDGAALGLPRTTRIEVI